MYCTQWLLHKLPILITFTLNINDLCEGADCIIFFVAVGFSCPTVDVKTKISPWNISTVSTMPPPSPQIGNEGGVSSHSCLSGLLAVSEVVRRPASCERRARPPAISSWAPGLLCSSVAASLQTQCMEKHWQKIRPLVHFLSPAAPTALGVAGSL